MLAGIIPTRSSLPGVPSRGAITFRAPAIERCGVYDPRNGDVGSSEQRTCAIRVPWDEGDPGLHGHGDLDHPAALGQWADQEIPEAADKHVLPYGPDLECMQRRAKRIALLAYRCGELERRAAIEPPLTRMA